MDEADTHGVYITLSAKARSIRSIRVLWKRQDIADTALADLARCGIDIAAVAGNHSLLAELGRQLVQILFNSLLAGYQSSIFLNKWQF